MRREDGTGSTRTFALLWGGFFALVALLAWWKPGTLAGAAIFTAGAAGIAALFNTEMTRGQRRAAALFPAGLLTLWAISRGWPVGAPGAALAVGVIGAAAMLGSSVFARRVRRVWVDAGSPIGWTISAALLGAVYFLVITPIGLVMRLLGKDPMHRAFHGGESYWTPRAAAEDPRRHYRQF